MVWVPVHEAPVAFGVKASPTRLPKTLERWALTLLFAAAGQRNPALSEELLQREHKKRKDHRRPMGTLEDYLRVIRRSRSQPGYDVTVT